MKEEKYKQQIVKILKWMYIDYFPNMNYEKIADFHVKFQKIQMNIMISILTFEIVTKILPKFYTLEEMSILMLLSSVLMQKGIITQLKDLNEKFEKK